MRFLVKVVIALVPSLRGRYSFHRYYEPSDFLLDIFTSSLLQLVGEYFFLEDLIRYPVFTHSL